MNLFRFLIAVVYVTFSILSFSTLVTSPNSSSTTTVSSSSSSRSSRSSTPNHVTSSNTSSRQHRRTMVENELDTTNFFQITSSQTPSLCIEVFQTLDWQVSRLLLQKCKSNGEGGMERQLFGVTHDGKLYPATKPSSCLFWYNNNNKKKLRYRKDCAEIFHTKKNQFGLDVFGGVIFLLGDVTNTKVMTVRELEERNEVQLQKESSSKTTKQHWTLHFERDRVLGNSCNSAPPPMPSGEYPPSTTIYPTSTPGPTTELQPVLIIPDPDSNQIDTRKAFNTYIYIWLKINMQGEYASDTENELYRELVEKYGDVDVFEVSFVPSPLVHFLQDETLRLVLRLVFRKASETWSDRERDFLNIMRYKIAIRCYWGLKAQRTYDLISASDRQYTFWVTDRVNRGIASLQERRFYNSIKIWLGDPEEWPSTSSPTSKPTSKPTSSLSVPLSSSPTTAPSITASLPTPTHNGCISDNGQLSAMFALHEKIKNGSASVHDSEHYDGMVRQFGPHDKWCLGKVTSMRNLFRGFSSFNQDISHWDVSGVTDFSHMLSGATSFNSDLSGWNVSQGVKFSGMFNKATSFSSDLSGWDVSKGKSFTRMFYKASSFNSDLSVWKVSKGISFSSMFNAAINFKQSLCDWDFSGALVSGRSIDKFCYGGANCFPSGGCRELVL